MGAAAGLLLVSLTHTQVHLPEVIEMIDFGTLMLLFSMMVNVHFLAETGFFQVRQTLRWPRSWANSSLL